MFLVVSDLLSAEELTAVRRETHDLSWEDGALTAGRLGREHKRNEQLKIDRFAEGRKRLLDRLMHHPEVARQVAPARAMAPVINRYRAGGGYDWHNDNPRQSGIRADVSFTLFLSDPHEYEGGELEIRSQDGVRSFKLPAGSAIVYDGATLHRVAPILSGERLAAVGWVESAVADARCRSVLAELRSAIERAERLGDRELRFSLTTVEADLARRWG